MGIVIVTFIIALCDTQVGQFEQSVLSDTTLFTPLFIFSIQHAVEDLFLVRGFQ